jgi:hypothetical protein
MLHPTPDDTSVVERKKNNGAVGDYSPFRGINMIDRRPAFYPHRRKLDGSFDSICLNCLATVANSADESELDEFDSLHVCDSPAGMAGRKVSAFRPN